MLYQGLTTKKAHTLLARGAFNELILKKRTSMFRRLVMQFADILVLILIAASAVSFFAGEHVDSVIIIVVVLINAAIGFLQEYKAERSMEALQNMVVPMARVVRDGHQRSIPARELVVGDLVILHEGDRIPADARILKSDSLKVEEAVLTGESVPVLKETKKDRVFMGTSVSSGSAEVIIDATGMDTRFGRVAHLTTTSKKDKSPLQLELENIGVVVLRVISVLCVILFAIGLYNGETVISSILFAVAMAVAAVPEGLPATVTISMALGVQRLGEKNAIVKKLTSVETLGSTNVICTDKTGTLTKNEMTVVVSYTQGEEYWFSGIGYDPKPELSSVNSRVKYLMRGLVLCQDAVLSKVSGRWKILGDPTEGALIVAARKCGIDELELSEKHPLKKTHPFDSVRKMMSMTRLKTTYTKGAPYQVLKNCSHYRMNNKILKLTDKKRRELFEVEKSYADQALRVLALATKTSSSKIEQSMCFEGFVGMIDPPREEVVHAVDLAHRAGIKVVVITGDSPITAKAIAKSIHICGDDVQVITGDDLADMSLGDLKKSLESEVIFARVSPSDKLRVVDTLKKMSKVVAVTGDGVNDAPALKRADIGIAMGVTGTDVSREVSDMILTDDSFSTIVKSIYEGRKIYDNMKKFIFYIFSSNIGEVVTVFLSIAMGLSMPLTAILILMINLGTDMFPSLALAVDEPSEDLMAQPPRESGHRIPTKDFLLHTVFVGGLIGLLSVVVYMLVSSYADPAVAKTSAFACLVMMQLTNVFNSRSRHLSIFKQSLPNYKIILSQLASTAFVLVIVYNEKANELFGTSSLSSKELGYILLAMFTLLFAEELRKIITKKYVARSL